MGFYIQIQKPTLLYAPFVVGKRNLWNMLYLDLSLLTHDAPQVGSYNDGSTVWTVGNLLLPNQTNTSKLRFFPYGGPYGELGTILSLEGLS